MVAGRDLVNAVEQRAHLVPAERHGVEDALVVPAGRHAGGEQGLRLRREVQGVLVPGVKERLDAEAIPCREDRPAVLVPQHEGELAAEMVQALRAEVLVEMQGDLAVGPGAQVMPARFELALDRFIAVELAVHHDPRPAVFTGDRLVAGGQVDDAQPGVAEPDHAIRRHPVALPVWAAMMEALGRAREGRLRDGMAAGDEGDDSAHGRSSLW
jgi:hypothetical protein